MANSIALREAHDLKTLVEASLGLDEFQQFLGKSYRQQKYLR